ncbi:MAG: prepilin-type N-terminal cleavage/methylation domain-containing protein [Planctomycetota bacterium]
MNNSTGLNPDNPVLACKGWTNGAGGSRTGFTLIEVLIVTVLVAFVLLASYKAYTQGVLVWARAQQTSRQEKAIMFIEKVSRELKNSFSFRPISFTAEEAMISFTGLVLKYDWDWSNKQGEFEHVPITSTALPLLAKITYEYKSDEGKGEISRLQEIYAYPDLDELKMNPDAFKKEEPKIILEDVEKLSFSYAMTKTTTTEIEFRNDFSIDEQKQLPYAMQIELKLKSMKAPLKRTIFIPINRSLKNGEKR